MKHQENKFQVTLKETHYSSVNIQKIIFLLEIKISGSFYNSQTSKKKIILLQRQTLLLSKFLGNKGTHIDLYQKKYHLFYFRDGHYLTN